MAEVIVVLNPGAGGENMDARSVVQPVSALLATREVVIPGGPNSEIQTFSTTGGVTSAATKDAGLPLALGQGVMTASTSVALASDQPPISVIDTSTSTLSNGTETVVAGAAVQVLAANAARKSAQIQNTGSANIRVGIAGVTAVTGYQLYPGDSYCLNTPDIPTGAVFAIREGATTSIAFAAEQV